MKNLINMRLQLIACLCMTILAGIISTNAQDSLRIRNRHDVPDTSNSDKEKLNGGALIDTIHLENKEPKGVISDTTSLLENKSDFYVFQSDERREKIRSVEEKIASLKASVMKNGSASAKAQIASLENKKNDLKSRLDKPNAGDAKEIERWNTDYADLNDKLQKFK